MRVSHTAQSIPHTIFVTVRQVRCALQGLADPDPRVVNEGTRARRNKTEFKPKPGTLTLFEGLICIGELAENLAPESLSRMTPICFERRLFLKKTLRLPPAHEFKPLSHARAGTHSDVINGLLHLLQVQTSTFHKPKTLTQLHHIPCSTFCLSPPLEIRLLLVFLNPCFTPLPVFQPTLSDKTSEYTSIALEAVLEVATVSFYNPDPFTFENCQMPCHQPTGPTLLCQRASHTRTHHALPRSPRPGKSSQTEPNLPFHFVAHAAQACPISRDFRCHVLESVIALCHVASPASLASASAEMLQVSSPPVFPPKYTTTETWGFCLPPIYPNKIFAATRRVSQPLRGTRPSPEIPRYSGTSPRNISTNILFHLITGSWNMAPQRRPRSRGAVPPRNPRPRCRHAAGLLQTCFNFAATLQ